MIENPKKKKGNKNSKLNCFLSLHQLKQLVYNEKLKLMKNLKNKINNNLLKLNKNKNKLL